MGRPKDIGTKAETAVVRAARTRGFPGADRLTLTGRHDRGDIALCPDVVVEVKGGNQARDASDLDIHHWLIDTETERHNARADIGFLVVQRRGVGPTNAHRWWAWWYLGDLETLRGLPNPRTTGDGVPVRIQLDDALYLLHHAGYGTPIEPTAHRAPTEGHPS